MTPAQFFTAHGDNLAAAVADMKTIDSQAFTTAARDNNIGSDAVRWVNLSQRLLAKRTAV